MDLNPIRAGIVKTPEESAFTSIYDRIQARKMEHGTASSQSLPDSWLCPITRDASPQIPSVLDMELDDYLRLVDW